MSGLEAPIVSSIEVIDNEDADQALRFIEEKSQNYIGKAEDRYNALSNLSKLEGVSGYDIDLAYDSRTAQYLLIHQDTNSVLNIGLSASQIGALSIAISNGLSTSEDIDIGGDANKRDIFIDTSKVPTWDEKLLSKGDYGLTEDNIEDVFSFLKSVKGEMITDSNIKGNMDDKNNLGGDKLEATKEVEKLFSDIDNMTE